jgi:uncharacterized membrane protein
MGIWLYRWDHIYLARCLLPLVWATGAGWYLALGIELRSLPMRCMCVAALVVAAGFVIWAYNYRTSSYVLYLNGRFLAALFAVLMAFGYFYAIRRLREQFRPEEMIGAWVVNAVTILLLFLLLNVETYLYCLKTIGDPERARWVGQMSLSIVWGVFAGGLLSVGFWRKVRPYRLTALGLFGLTSLKLVLIDMANSKEVYRIVSFFVLGILMIGASYLYHRVEKWLEASAAEKQDEDSEQPAEPPPPE